MQSATMDMVRKCLFIASEVRSGSTLVAESLAYELHRNFGFSMWDLAKEPFAYVDDSTGAQEVVNTWSRLYLDSCGFTCAKIMCKALSAIHRLADSSEDVKQAFFGTNAYWLVVRRRDRISQAVSLAMAHKSGLYHFYGEADHAPDKDLRLTNAEVESALRAVSLSDIYLDTFASTLPESRILTCYYEDFMADEIGSLNRIHRLCGFASIDSEKFVNEAKLRPTAQDSKRLARDQFRQWFLLNYV